MLAAALTLVLLLSACTGGPQVNPPYAPSEALKTLAVAKGFRVELFASEPMISDPVAMEFDEYGRIFVVENHGYPLDTSGSSCVKLLEDADGDGRPDRSTVFVDKLVLPTGVMRWKKGVLVTDAPNIWYFEDTDGDGRADIRRVVLTGFPFTNPQHTVNSPIYGLDNWIYVAHEPATKAVIFKDKFGDPGSDIRFPDRSDVPPLKVKGSNIRFRPDTYQIEALSGNSQFGHTFDEWGHHFVLNNSNHVRHEVIAARYLERNPELLVTTAMQDMSDHGNACKVFPITFNPEYQMLTDIGQITSACGLTLYLGGAFPGFNRVSFVAEPAHNLVHQDVWSESGVTFVAKRAQEGGEFLASTDSWFRPVNFYIGPDGALYVVDYYRRIIEHPEWMSDEFHSHDRGPKVLYEGSDKGRIYRIVPDSPTAPMLPRNIRLGEASDQELVKQLENPNIWWRRTAQRLLVDRKSAEAVKNLVRLFRESRSPVARLHALWTLDGIGKLDAKLIEIALDDREPGVRENAIRLAEPLLSGSPELIGKLLGMTEDEDPKVRLQLLCALGFINSASARRARARLLFRDIEDEWMQIAALSASSDCAPQLFEAALSCLTEKETKGRRIFFQRVCSVIGARRNVGEIRRIVQTVANISQTSSEWWRAASLEGLALGAKGKQWGSAGFKVVQDLLLRLFDSSTPSLRRASLQVLETMGVPTGPSVARALKRAEATAANEKADPDARADAISLLALVNPASYEQLFKKLIDPKQPEQVQAEAVRGLGRVKGGETGQFLLTKFKTMTPSVRAKALDALFLEPGRVKLLLDAIKSGQIEFWTLGQRHKIQLANNKDSEISKSYRALLDERIRESEKVVQRYKAALQIKGDATRGEQVFRQICAKCHKLNGMGAEVGPDLGTVRNRAPQLLLRDILVPSESIAQNYEAYMIETVNGAVVEGVVAAQTPTTITLRQEGGKMYVILRKDIKQMYVSNVSAMPEGLNKQIDVQQMADLLKFLTKQ